MPLNERTLSLIRKKAEEYKVKKLILFGSCLHNTEDEAGDIDLAAEMPEGGDICQFHGDLLLSSCGITEKNIDMVDLVSDTHMVPFVMEEGILLYEAPE